jgi:hypothetical protein
MTTTLFEYPRNAAFGRVLPKSKIYQHGSPSSAIKEFFVRQVEQIAWQYKLAPETINIKGTPFVPEIQVFSVALRNGELKTEVLRCIDQTISFPILFELRFDGKVKPIAAFKRPSEVDSAKWVISEYFDGDWVSCDTPRKPLPIVFDLDALYGYLLTPLMPYPARTGESLQARVERIDLIRLKQRELERGEARLHKEKQFNRKVAVNAELHDLKQELENLTRQFPVSGAAAAL